MGKSSINGSFSIAMLNNQMVLTNYCLCGKYWGIGRYWGHHPVWKCWGHNPVCDNCDIHYYYLLLLYLKVPLLQCERWQVNGNISHFETGFPGKETVQQCRACSIAMCVCQRVIAHVSRSRTKFKKLNDHWNHPIDTLLGTWIPPTHFEVPFDNLT